MEFFESNGNWIIALGKTLVHSLWIGALLFSLLKISVQQSASLPSGLKYKLAVAALLLFIGTVVSLFFLLYAPDLAPPYNRLVTLKTKAFSEFQEPGPFSIMIIYKACSYLYFLGILVVLFRWAFSLRHVRRLKRSGRPAEGAWIDRLRLIGKSLGIKRNVELLVSEKVSVPALFGLLKPLIIVPAGMLSSLPILQVETILMHELYHLRRLDFLVNLFQIIAEGLFFYNPAVQAISKIIRTEREICCDDLVLQQCGRPLDYARALFELAKHHNSAAMLYPAATGKDHHQLFDRIIRILNQNNMKSNIRERLSTLLMLAGGVVLLFLFTGFSQSFSKVQHDFLKPEVEYDTVPGVRENQAEIESTGKPDQEEFENEGESAKRDATEEIDWEQIRRDIKEAKEAALEEIDWEQIRRDIKEAKEAALEEIDWEALHEELGQTKIHMDSILKEIDFDLDFDMDFEDLRTELEDALKELKEIDFGEIRMDIEKSIAELKTIDVEEIRKEFEKLKETVE